MAKTLVYQLYPASWVRITEMTCHLYRICKLGVDYVWLGPIYLSPWHDHGYDVKDYCDIHPAFGTMKDFDDFVATAHQLGIKVLMDLVLNHTSTEHEWFAKKPEYYCWSYQDCPGWQNLFNGGSAWRYDSERDGYYLHLFHKEQADLNWFPNDQLNQDLVTEFKQIVAFWTEQHNVDGFRLDVPQAINKDFTQEVFEFPDLLRGRYATEVINAIFSGEQTPFLIMECFDPTFGKIVEYYADNTPVDYVLNMMVKDSVASGWTMLTQRIEESSLCPSFMLDLESHDSARFPSRANVPPRKIIQTMFSSSAKGICLYQGQELGLKNPSKQELDDEEMLRLDAQTEMRHLLGEELDGLRPLSRANARIALPLEEYAAQMSNKLDSCFFYTKRWIEHWKKS